MNCEGQSYLLTCKNISAWFINVNCWTNPQQLVCGMYRMIKDLMPWCIFLFFCSFPWKRMIQFYVLPIKKSYRNRTMWDSPCLLTWLSNAVVTKLLQYYHIDNIGQIGWANALRCNCQVLAFINKHKRTGPLEYRRL